MRWSRERRRGNTALYFALALPVIGGFGAFAIEYAYVRHVEMQLEGVNAAASHAALVELQRDDWTFDSARAAAIGVVEGNIVDDAPYSLDPNDVVFGYYNPVEGFVESDDRMVVNAVRTQLVEHDVGLGFGLVFLGREMSVSTCSAVAYGIGHATTDDEGGPGLVNGHFDYDTVEGREYCPGDQRCEGTTKHTHEYDDDFDVTYASLFSGFAGHLRVNDCTENGRIRDCADPDASRFLPDGQPFKIQVVNAELSPGAWITINGVDYDVEAYDNIPFSNLPIYHLGTGESELTELQMNFDVNAIANCELIPTQTRTVRANTPGIEGEWRSGALTIQLVEPSAIPTSGTGNGDHQAVTTQNDGLLYEATYFWHWSGASYIAAQAEQWQADYDALDCPEPEFIDDAPGGSVCP
ncbi:MAG: pilus assembly protein [Deltaproteobacteria bacterium]|nr:pilus assembly protein [Deltaproteobacteria bacterium]